MHKEEPSIQSGPDISKQTSASSDQSSAPPEYHDLDHLAGTWDEAQAEEFLRLTHEQRTIEIDLWTAAAAFSKAPNCRQRTAIS